MEVRDLPEAGELEVEVTRLATLVFEARWVGGRARFLRGSPDLPVLCLAPSSHVGGRLFSDAFARFGEDEGRGRLSRLAGR